jgi:magnesium chelatase subunit I
MKIEYKRIKTLGELKKAGYQTRLIKDELRENLRERIRNGLQSFPGSWG